MKQVVDNDNVKRVSLVLKGDLSNKILNLAKKENRSISNMIETILMKYDE